MRDRWDIKKLGDVCDLQNGFAFKSKSYVESSNTLNIRMSNIRPDGSFNPEHKIRFLPDSFSKEYSQFLLEEGDLVIAMTDMAGDPKILGLPTMVKNLNGRNFLLNQRVGKLMDISDDINVNYLTYYLGSPIIKEYYKSKGAGGLQLNISKKDILSVDIPIPPIEEQKEIVEILEQAFESIDKAKANIEKNIDNAKELFESKLNQVFSQAGEGWKEKKIIELCKHKSQIVGGPFGSNLKVKDYKEQGIPILRLQNIGKGYFIDKAIKYISEEKAKELSYHSFSAGDIALAKLGIPIGKTCIVPNKFKYGIVVADVVRIRPNKEQVNYDFLKYFLNSDCSVRQLTADIKGATRPRVNISEVRNLKLSIPNITKQKEIVETLDVLDNHIQSVLLAYKEELDNLEELKKSILQKAFSGELTNKNKAA